MRSLIMALILCCTALTGPVQASPANQSIRAQIERFEGLDFKCSRVRKLFRRLSRERPAMHFAFAGRKAPTITGIRGCGYAWGSEPRDVRLRAMAECRKQEAQLGTGPKGDRTCRILR